MSGYIPASMYRDSDVPVVDEVSGVEVSKSVSKSVSKWWPGFEEPEHPAITEAREKMNRARMAMEVAERDYRAARNLFMDACVLYKSGDPDNERKQFS